MTGGTGAIVERTLVGVFVGLAAFGLCGTATLLAHAHLPAWLLPAAAALGVAAALRHRAHPVAAPAPAPAQRGLARWLPWCIALLLAALAAHLAHGALATPSRHWDGAVAWDLKANVLAAAPTLQQPFFRDAAVYCHSRDYPLLQPMLVALAERAGVPGRLLFPLAFVALVGAVAAAARGGGHGRSGAWFALAAGCTPMVLAPTSGGLDSGYADGLLLATVAATALGVVAPAPLLVAAGAAVLALLKPEGLPYAALLVAACWLHGSRAVLLAAVCGAGAGGALAISLQRDLASFGTASPWPPLLLIAAAAVTVLAADAQLRRRALGARARTGSLLAAVPLLAIAVMLLPSTGSLGSHLAIERALDRVGSLPRLIAGIAEWALASGRYGLTFVLPALLLLARRPVPGEPLRTRALGAWLLLAAPVLCLPFLLSPLADLEHHLRSTLPRLLLHWVGATWVWMANRSWPHAIRDPVPSPRT